MAIQLKDKTNVTAPAAPYPYGDVKDNTGSNDGTPLDRAVMSDYFQFFARMLAQSGITPNDLIENDTNGYQYFEALVKAVNLNNSAGVIETGNQVVLKTKVLEIGDWDMDANIGVTVTHGLSDITKIRSIDLVIRTDAGVSIYPWKMALTTGNPIVTSIQVGIDGNAPLTATVVNLTRETGGHYDSTAYDSTSFNRGWVTIVYEV